MRYSRLFILVEGPDDIRFFETVLRPRFEQRYDNVKVLPYANRGPDWVKRLIRSFDSMGAKYLFVADIDAHPCVTSKKQEIVGRYGAIPDHCIVVVIREIEGWYLAGLNAENSKKLRIRGFRNTDAVAKLQFDGLWPRRFKS